MRFGAFLPTYWNDYASSPIHVAINGVALAAEALGYEGVWANDQMINPAAARRGTLAGAQVIEPLVTLASLVHLVPRLTLGVAVLILPQRNAILVAKQAAALHLLSQHRLILGVGIGHRAEEFAILGANFGQRAEVTDEAIEVMQTLWSEPVAGYHGQFHDFNGVTMPPHAADDGPPIWIGGNSAGAIRRAARYGSGWLPYGIDLDALRSGASLMRELTRERQCPTIANMFYLRIEKPDEPSVVQSTSPWMEARFAGSPNAITQHLEEYRRAGLDYALCAFESEDLDDLLRQMRVFAEHVAPRFADAG
jgi:probable F420-dependent oxidoreductase